MKGVVEVVGQDGRKDWSRWRRIVAERKESDILIEESIMRLAQDVILEKFTGIHKDDPR